MKSGTALGMVSVVIDNSEEYAPIPTPLEAATRYLNIVCF